MTRKLWRLALIRSFGGWWRLAGAACLAVSLSFLLARLTRTIPMVPELPQRWLYACTAIASYGLTGFALLALSTSKNQIAHIARVLPFRRRDWWIVELAPRSIVAGLLFVIIAPSLTLVTQSTHVPAAATLGIWLGSSLAGLALTLPTRAGEGSRVIFFMGFSVIQIMLLQESLSRATLGYNNIFLPLWGVVGMQCLALPKLVVFLWQGPKPTNPLTRQNKLTLPRQSLALAWFSLKLRHPGARLSFMCCGLIMATTAIALYLRHAAPLSPDWLLLGAIIASAFACDLRSLSRDHHAPEIEVLKGPVFFVHSQIRTTLSISILLGLPIFALLMREYTGNRIALTAVFLALQTCAGLLGLLAGTFLARHSGDLGSQFIAVLCATGAVLAIPAVAHFSHYSLFQQATAWALIALACYGVTRFIEITRRQRYGAL